VIETNQAEQEQSKKEDDPLQKVPFMKITMRKTEKKYDGRLGSIVRYEEAHFAIQEFFMQAETSIVLDNLHFITITLALFNFSTNDTGSRGTMSRGSLTDAKHDYGQWQDKELKDICPFMDASRGIVIDETQIDVNKLSFGIIMLGSVKAKITLNLEGISSLNDLDLVSSNRAVRTIFNWIAPFLQNFASISNATITLNELVILEAFISW